MFDCRRVTVFNTNSSDTTIRQYIELLERLFTFKDDWWKYKIASLEKENTKYYLSIRIDNPDNITNYSQGQKLVVSTRIEVWDRDDAGVDFILALTIE